MGDIVSHYKYEVRFSFDWSKVMEIISKVSPDVLIVNQVEQVPHYKAIIQALGINVSIGRTCQGGVQLHKFGGVQLFQSCSKEV